MNVCKVASRIRLQIMNGIYDECYKSLEVKNPLAADALFDNREALVIAGEGNLHLSDLL